MNSSLQSPARYRVARAVSASIHTAQSFSAATEGFTSSKGTGRRRVRASASRVMGTKFNVGRNLL